jgi:signal transduction histidine kinase
MGPSLRALARGSPIPVQLTVDIADRPPQPIEIAVYYVVSEILTNATRHAHASAISIEAISADKFIRATITDDGVGGADASIGTGLTGLIDRVEALGGQFSLESPVGSGTTVSVNLPAAVIPPSGWT